jgi:hypothetical protein
MKNHFISYVLPILFIGVTITSCSKKSEVLQKEETVQSTGSFEEFKSWMTNNVKQTDWADTNYFYWQVIQLKLDNILASSRGISYMKNCSDYIYPSIEQNTSGFMRTIEVGNPSPTWCSFYRETASAVNLYIKTSSGKEYRWNNCPVKISEHETNPTNLPWGVSIPKNIEVIVADKGTK